MPFWGPYDVRRSSTAYRERSLHPTEQVHSKSWYASVCPYMYSMQGLSTEVAHRLAHMWRFPAPVKAQVLLPIDFDAPEDIQAGTEAALMQLSVLPAGSLIQFLHISNDPWWPAYQATVAAITTTAPHLTHLTVVPPPPTRLTDEVIATMCAQDAAPSHMAVLRLERGLSVAPATAAWPWRSLRFALPNLSLHFDDILWLPDPTGGVYDFEVGTFLISGMDRVSRRWPIATIAQPRTRVYCLRDSRLCMALHAVAVAWYCNACPSPHLHSAWSVCWVGLCCV